MISLSPIDYYFYRPDLFTIQFVFEFEQSLDRSRLLAGLQTLPTCFDLTRMVLAQTSDKTLILKSDSRLDIPVTESIIETSIDMDDQGFLATCVRPVDNELGQPLVRFHISHERNDESKTRKNRSYLGVSFSHILGDGFSFVMFLRALSMSCRGQFISMNPFLDRSILEPKSQTQSPNSLKHIYSDTRFSYSDANIQESIDHQTIYFNRDFFDETRQEVLSESSVKVSDNDIVMATLLLKFVNRIPLTETGKVAVRCPVDLRNVVPNFPREYFGNGIKDAMAEFDPNLFQNLSIGQITAAIRAAVKSIDNETIENYLSRLKNIRLQNGLDVFKQIFCPGLLVTNLSRLPFFDLDFGCGSPLSFQTVTPCPRLAIILPDPNGLKVSVYLPT